MCTMQVSLMTIQRHRCILLLSVGFLYHFTQDWFRLQLLASSLSLNHAPIDYSFLHHNTFFSRNKSNSYGYHHLGQRTNHICHQHRHSVVRNHALPSSQEEYTHKHPQQNIYGYTPSDLQQRGYNTFQSKFSYPLDSWQCEAGGGITLGMNVIVTAPTGAGKTAVGIMALSHIFQQQRDSTSSSSFSDTMGTAIYTTPLKALSNQKFVELKQVFGSQHVGLSTGDMCIQRGAMITVMTTEVYRNMCWKSTQDITTPNDPVRTDDDDDDDYRPFATKKNLNTSYNSIVVLDEFHYMGVPGRGTVWEESVITSPKTTQLVALSATLSNARSIATWMERVTNRPTLLVDVSNESRPVPLRYYFATTKGIFPLFRDVDAGPGAPHGLLGLRGDYGIIQRKSKKIENQNSESKIKQKHGFQKSTSFEAGALLSKSIPDNTKTDTLPKGLQLHPTLARIEQQRLDNIHRIMAKRVLANRWERIGTKNEGWKDVPTSSSLSSNSKSRFLKAQDSSFNFNPQKMSREERRERDQLLRQEMKKSVPSLFFLVDRLQHMDLLPAIFFIFSRVGCDNAAESVCQSMRRKGESKQTLNENDGADNNNRMVRKKENKKNQRIHHGEENDLQSRNATRHRGIRLEGNAERSSSDGSTVKDKDGRRFRKQSNYISEDVMSFIMEGDTSYPVDNILDSLVEDQIFFYSQRGLLDRYDIAQVMKRVQSFNDENPEIKFEDETVERFYFGIASHHAGQLPAHKAFVESLFRAQLIKVVFATETLAAGINVPARTTVICSLAKRGDNQNMNLLETSALLQMAGRSGRRGMDTDGTCIIVATPFEGPSSAIDILTDELKPVVSQFTPSYSLVVNLIARGNGTLDVARRLVQSSFAYFEREESEQRVELAREAYGDDYELVYQSASHDYFVETLKGSVERLIDSGALMGKQALLHDRICHLLNDKVLLKKESKAYLSLSRMYDIEENTLKTVQSESMKIAENGSELVNIDGLIHRETQLDDELHLQKGRVTKALQALAQHIFTDLTSVANSLLLDDIQSSESLRYALKLARKGDASEKISPIDPLELTTYVKSYVSDSRKRRKHDALGRSIGISSPASLMDSIDHVEFFPENAWKDTIALTKVLTTYGCLVDVGDNAEHKKNFRITTGGNLLLELGLENSLWCIIALGGAWDIDGSPVGADEEGKNRWKRVVNRTDDEQENNSFIPESQRDAANLIASLRELDPSEMAGYVSCLVADEIRGSSFMLPSFDKISPKQKGVIQQAFLALDRLDEIQRHYDIDILSRKAQIELGACQVITAWASGCTWADALGKYHI